MFKFIAANVPAVYDGPVDQINKKVDTFHRPGVNCVLAVVIFYRGIAIVKLHITMGQLQV